MPTAALLLLAIVLGLTGCAGGRTVELVRMPQRDAELYPWAQKQAGVAVTVDEIADSARVSQYFGVDLLADGLLPVNIIVSNYGRHRVAIKPADILLLNGRAVIDPLPAEQVAAIAKRRMGRLRAETARDVEEYFASLALQETTLAPNGSYQGVLFFPRPPPSERDRFFTVLSLYRDGGLRMHVGATDVDTRERLRFGPFRLSVPEDRGGYFGASRRWR